MVLLFGWGRPVMKRSVELLCAKDLRVWRWQHFSVCVVEAKCLICSLSFYGVSHFKVAREVK